MDRIWLDQYPEQVVADIDPDSVPSLVDLFEQSVAEFADQGGFINMGQELNYAQLDQQSRAFAAYLQQGLKLARGARVAIMMPNLLQYPVVLFGILRAGMVAVNVNPLYTARELKHQLKDSGTETIVIIANFAQTLEQVIDETPVKHVILTQLGDLFVQPKRTLVNLVVKYVKKMVPKYHLPHATSLLSALHQGTGLSYTRPEVSGDDLAFLQYTGGTTGVAKGAMLTHRNMVANVEQVVAVIRPGLVSGQELIVTPLPLYHVFSLTANLLTFLRFGAKNLLITNPRDLPSFIKELSSYPFTAMTGVNTLFNALLNAPQFKQLDFSKLKLAMGGGMAVQRPVAEQWESVTGTPLLEGYGLTECSPVVAVVPINQRTFTGSIGLPVPSTDVKLLDDDGRELGIGESGELWVKGPQVMKGYWQRPEATAEAIKEGWFGTGDIATIDAQGFLRIVDRKKDMIVVSGFNVFPNEVEEVAMMHPAVLEAAVIGVPDEVAGERVKLFVVCKEGETVSKEALVAHCRDNLTGYKVPRIIEYRDELPKTNVGKILRRQLRD